MVQNINLEKEFENMSWHDNAVYSICPPDQNNRLNLDIDYILEWKKLENDKSYSFVVAPAILSFENIINLTIHLSFDNLTELFIDEISRTGKRKSPNGEVFIWDYKISTDKGNIEFTATGFKQWLTNEPKELLSQKYNR